MLVTLDIANGSMIPYTREVDEGSEINTAHTVKHLIESDLHCHTNGPLSVPIIPLLHESWWLLCTRQVIMPISYNFNQRYHNASANTHQPVQ